MQPNNAGQTDPSRTAGSLRLAVALLFATAVSALPLSGVQAQDVVVSLDETEHNGRVVQATEGVVVIELPPTAENPLPPPLSLDATQIMEIRFGSDPAAEIQADMLVKRWTSIDVKSRRLMPPSSGEIAAGLRAAIVPTVLAVIDGWVVSNDKRLVMESPKPGQASTRTIAEPLIEALMLIKWWRVDLLLRDVVLSTESSHLRAKCMEYLGNVACARTIPPLTEMLSNPEEAFHTIPAMLSRLSTQGHAAEIFELLQPLLSDPSDLVRLRVWQALRGGNLEIARPSLLKAISDPSASVRREIADMMGLSKEREDGQILFNQVEAEIAGTGGSHDIITIQKALAAIGKSRFYFLIPALIELGEQTEDQQIREFVVGALQGELSSHAKHGTVWSTWRYWWDNHGSKREELEASLPTPGQHRAILYSTDDAAQKIMAIRGLTSEPAFLSNAELMDFVIAADTPPDEQAAMLPVRIAAIVAVQNRAKSIRSQNPEIFDRLIDLLERERDPGMIAKLKQALVDINGNGVDMGTDAKLWREYLQLYHAPSDAILTDLLRQILEDGSANSGMRRCALDIIRARQQTTLLSFIAQEFLATVSSDVGLTRQTLQLIGDIAKPEGRELPSADSIDACYAMIDFLDNPNTVLSGTARNSLTLITGEKRAGNDKEAWAAALQNLSEKRETQESARPNRRK